jgi:hypothetical protein
METYQRDTVSSQTSDCIDNGTERLGWFARYSNPVIGIDIDDGTHNKSWHFDSWVLPIVHKRYDLIRSCFGPDPSLVVRSPHGLHVYYLLNTLLGQEALHQLTRRTIGDLEVELKPTSDDTLRIPKKSHIVDPSDITRFLYPHPSDRIEWESIPTYSPEHLFGENYRNNINPFTSAKARPPRSKIINYELIRQAEEDCLPFRNGETNEQLKWFVSRCRKAGMDLDRTIDLVQSWISRSTSYTGDLNSSEDLVEKRVEYIYNWKSKHTKAMSAMEPAKKIPTVLDPATTDAIERIAIRYPFPKQAQNGFKIFVTELIRWKLYQDKIMTKPELFRQHSDKYPFYRPNRLKGYYPLPHLLIMKWNSRHSRILKWLICEGILEPSPFKHSARGGICKYYKINLPFTIIPS